MPRVAHSISFSRPRLDREAALDRIWEVLESLGAAGGGAYGLSWYATDDSDIAAVASHEGLPRGTRPKITEPPNTYNFSSISAWIETHEMLVVSDSRWSPVRHGIVFMGNAVKFPGREWTAELLERLVVRLDIDCAVLDVAGDEEQVVYRRRGAGEHLIDITIERLRQQASIPPPLLAVLRSTVAPPGLQASARAAQMRVGTMPSGAIMFSQLHDE